MKLFKKASLALFAVCAMILCMVLCAANLSAAEVTASGECGDNLTWTLYDNGNLVIEGTGAMWDWDRWNDPAPWDALVKEIKTISIGEGVTHIGSAAFFPCSNAENVIIPSSVVSIGNTAFRNCESLTSVTLPETVTTIGNWAFGYCSSLTELTIPQAVSSIGSNAFQNCSSLTKITLPDTLTSILGGTFSHCTSLESITIPTTVEKIGNYAFSFCASLTEAVIPENVSSLGKGVFGGCTSLGKVTVLSPDAVFNGDLFTSAQGSLEGIPFHGYAGSTTEAYAAANRHNFVALESPAIPGDISDDGTLDINDAIALFQYSMLPDIFPISYTGKLDFTGDGIVDVNDAIRLFQHSMLPDIFPL